MRTELMDEIASGTPWLERGAGGGPGERLLLESLPFTIGRKESSDLCVDSSRVSREHALITREDDQFRLCDLGSTNGTFVNGERITERCLHDGDLVVIADTEFVFHAPLDDLRGMQPTHVMDGPRETAEHELFEAAHAVRAVRQALTHRCLIPSCQSIVSLEDQRMWAYEIDIALPDDLPGDMLADLKLLAAECQLSQRWREMSRILAAEQLAQWDEAPCRIFRLASVEIGTPSLHSCLERLSELTETHNRLGVTIAQAAVCDIPYFHDFLARLRERRIVVVFGGFAGGQLPKDDALIPDWLQLAPSLVADLAEDSAAQRQVRQMVQAARQRGCQIIAAGVQSHHQAAACLEVGCQAAQGELFGPPRPLAPWLPQESVESA